MSQTVKINGQTYNDVKAIEIPLASDPTQVATYPDTSDANAVAESIKNGESGYVKGKKVVGTMPVNGAGGGVISAKDGTVAISKGFYDGTGKVAISETEKAKLIASNIRKGVTVLGVAGNMSATEGMKAQAKTVTPTESEQIVTPDSDYNALSQVTVGAIPSTHIKTDDATAVAEDIKQGETAYVNGKKVTGTHTDPTFTLTDGVLKII